MPSETIYFPKDLHKAITDHAELTHATFAEVVKEAARQYLAQWHDDKEKAGAGQ